MSVVAICALAILMGLVMSPSGDPFSFMLYTVVLAAFGMGAFAGGWFARTHVA